MKLYYEKRKSEGKCRSCSNKLAEHSVAYCEVCLAKRRECNKKRQHLYKGRKYQLDPVKARFRSIKSRAKKSNIVVETTGQEFCEWYESRPKECYYCGITQAQLMNGSENSKKSLEIDRMNNNVGYVLDNMCLSCRRCNNCKSNFFSSQEWKEIADQYIKRRLDEWANLRNYG